MARGDGSHGHGECPAVSCDVPLWLCTMHDGRCTMGCVRPGGAPGAALFVFTLFFRLLRVKLRGDMVLGKFSETTEPKRSTHAKDVHKLPGTHMNTRL